MLADASVLLNERKRTIAAVEFDPSEPVWSFLDAGYGDDFARIRRAAAGFPRLVSRDAADRRWIVALSRSDAPVRYVAYDRDTRVVTPLYSENPALANHTHAPKHR